MHFNCSRAICSPRAPMGIKYLAFPCCEIRIRSSIGLGSGNSCSIINSETGFSLDLAFHKYPSLHTCLISYYSSGRLIGTEVSRKTPMGSTQVDSHPHKKGQWTGCISLTILFFLDICTAPCCVKSKLGCCCQWMLNTCHSDTLKGQDIISPSTLCRVFAQCQLYSKLLSHLSWIFFFLLSLSAVVPGAYACSLIYSWCPISAKQ